MRTQDWAVLRRRLFKEIDLILSPIADSVCEANTLIAADRLLTSRLVSLHQELQLPPVAEGYTLRAKLCLRTNESEERIPHIIAYCEMESISPTVGTDLFKVPCGVETVAQLTAQSVAMHADEERYKQVQDMMLDMCHDLVECPALKLSEDYYRYYPRNSLFLMCSGA